MNKTLTTVLRVVLGIVLLVFGFNKFFGFIEMPTPPPGSFMEVLFSTGYMIPLIALSEIIPGLLLLANKWKGFALAWLVPISVNILLFHFKFDMSPAGMAPAVLVAALNGLLIYANWGRFKTLF